MTKWLERLTCDWWKINKAFTKLCFYW